MKSFLKYELIGLRCEVIKSNNKCLEGLYGEVIDETKNTLKLKTESGIKTVIKNQATFLFYFNDYWIVVEGKLLVDKPWERLKKKVIKKV